MVITDNRLRLTMEDGFCILLARLVYPNRLAGLERVFGRDFTSLSRISNSVLSLIFDRWSHLLSFDHRRLTPQKLGSFADVIHAKGAPLTRCWGFIDGTVRPICRPKYVS